jgi:Putative Ig domain
MFLIPTVTVTVNQELLLLAIIIGGMLLAGGVVIAGRRWVQGGADQPVSVIRSWIAISLVMGLLVFCAMAFLLDDAAVRSTLFGGLIASVGVAVAFYFSSKAADQARTDILNAAVALSQGATPPSGFTATSPPDGPVMAQYSYRLAATGQPTPTFVLASGALANGLSLSTDGILTGQPTDAGTYTFTVRATNSAGSIDSPTISLKINPAA